MSGFVDIPLGLHGPQRLGIGEEVAVESVF
jgi:hypothetical protein